jgi:hypothetical protein
MLGIVLGKENDKLVGLTVGNTLGCEVGRLSG